MDDDYEYTQLPDDEMADYLAKQEARRAREREEEAKLQARIRSFRFTGGML